MTEYLHKRSEITTIKDLFQNNDDILYFIMNFSWFSSKNKDK